VPHLRRTIPDLSLERDSLKGKDPTTSCGISITHKKTTASVKGRSTQTELTDLLAQQLHDLGVQLQHRTCQMKPLAAREDRALNRQRALEQHLNASRSDLGALRWQIQRTDQAFQRNEILTSQLSTQARDTEHARRQVAASQQHEEELEVLLGKIEGEVSTNQESDQNPGPIGGDKTEAFHFAARTSGVAGIVR
jgi:chromosome segregation ATPase